MSILIGIGAFVFLLAVVVFFHELGHFLAAKAFGMRVRTFSLFFGRRLFGITIGETDYRVSLIPLGGYVRLLGEFRTHDDTRTIIDLLPDGWVKSMLIGCNSALLRCRHTIARILRRALAVFPKSQKGEKVPSLLSRIKYFLSGPKEPALTCDPSEAFTARPRWQQIIVLLAGPAFSFGLCIALLFGIFFFHGTATTAPFDAPPVIAAVGKNSPAAAAGIVPGDRIVQINGREVSKWSDAHLELSLSPGKPLPIVFERSGTILTATITPVEATKYRMGYAGMAPLVPPARKLSAPEALIASLAHTKESTMQMGFSVKKMAAGDIRMQDALSGPVEIATISHTAAHQGFVKLLYLIALISMILGIMNLLPIPLLDGGQILILSMEAIRRKSFSPPVFAFFNRFGFALIMLLMASALWFDLQRNIPLLFS